MGGVVIEMSTLKLDDGVNDGFVFPWKFEKGIQLRVMLNMYKYGFKTFFTILLKLKQKQR